MKFFKLSNIVTFISLLIVSLFPLGTLFHFYKKHLKKEEQAVLYSYSLMAQKSVNAYLKTLFSSIQSLQMSLQKLHNFQQNRGHWDQHLLSLMYNNPLIQELGITVDSGQYALMMKARKNTTGFRSFLAQPHLKDKDITEIVYDAKGHKESSHSYTIPEDYFSSVKFFAQEFDLVLGKTSESMTLLVQKDLKPHWNLSVSSSEGLALAYPLREDRCLLGTLFVHFDFHQLTKEIRQLIENAKFIDIFIYDQNHTVLFAPREKHIYIKDEQGKQVLPNMSDLDVPSLQQAMDSYDQSADSGESFFSIDTKNKAFLFSGLDKDLNTQWTFVATLSDHFLHNRWIRLWKLIIIATLFMVLSATAVTGAVNAKMSLFIRQIGHSLTQSLSGERIQPINSSFQEIRDVEQSIKKINRGLVMLKKIIPQRWLTDIFNQEEPSLISQQESLSIVYCTLCNFLDISHHLSPEQLRQYICQYLGDITHIINCSGGKVDQYIGESLQSSHNHQLQEAEACQAALKCLLHLDTALNPSFKELDFPRADLRLGISQGPGISGYVGSDEQMKYTVLGYCVTRGKVLADLNTVYGTRILVDETIQTKVEQEYIVRPIDRVSINGTQNMIYELLGRYGDKHLDIYQGYLAELTRSAWQAYQDQNWKEAKQKYTKVLSEFPQDLVAPLFIQRCSKKK